MRTTTLQPELLDKIDAYWRAANYLSVGQIYLRDNPLLKRPLELSDVKAMLERRADRILDGLSSKLTSAYAATGRPSVPPERLLEAQ